MDDVFCRNNAKDVEVRLAHRLTRAPLPASPAVQLHLRATETGTPLASSTITLTRDATDAFRWTGRWEVSNLGSLPAPGSDVWIGSNVESDPRVRRCRVVASLPWDG